MITLAAWQWALVVFGSLSIGMMGGAVLLGLLQMASHHDAPLRS